MLINGIELSNLGIQLFDRVLYSNSIDTAQEWLDGDIQPTFIRQQDRFKTIDLQFLVLCADEDEAFRRISRLTAMLKKATVKFDDLDLMFDVSITTVGEPTRLKNGNFVVPYTLSSGYAKGQREIYTTNANMTNSFKLTVAYYKNSTTLLESETVVVRASAFDKENLGLSDLGIDVNKYQPQYHNAGIATNLNGLDLTYENLQSLKVLIINYAPISYNLAVNYYLDNGQGMYNEILNRTVAFTQASLANYQTIGQLVGVNDYRPEGYKGKVSYDGALAVEDLLSHAPIDVFYDKIETELSKNIFVSYKSENDEGEYDTIQSVIINVSETQFYDGLTLKDIISIDGYNPNPSYYNAGYINGFASNALVSFEDIQTSYTVIYAKSVNTIYVEYYAGVYPDWHRLSTTTLQTKHLDKYDDSFNVLTDLNLDLNKYHTAPYNDGALYNQGVYQSYDDVLNTGVLQVYYTAIDYPITVNYYVGDLAATPITETVNINALMFFGNPILSDIIPILSHRPEGYQFSENFSYDGEVTLEALTQASPISVVYEEIEVMRSKNIIVRYKKELSSAYATITTNLITVNEADVIGGVRLKDIINLDAYRPEYYDSGVVDGASSTALTTFDALGSSYDVLYVAKSYSTPVRYYLDEIDDLHWIGSAVISYRVIDFEASTTLYDFGLNLNAYKPSYAGDGVLQYTGLVNFTALLELPSVDVLYITETTPPDEEGIDYPHRFLFLQHNDLGSYEYLHPEWTMNHAFINTGITVEDMSKLTVVMECARVDENVPLYQVNAGYAYLFGSTGGQGTFYMRYNNQTLYGENLTGVNTYEAKAGNYSNTLVLTEDSAVGFSENTGIYSSPQEGYSRATFTYSNLLATDGAPMTYPLYLFANNNHGTYSNGIAGVGIYSCRIYYNDQLIRDFIPVQFYDKIGDLVAPSNCLYDKVSKAFFEDETRLNSFNIRDDDRYEDTNLQHQIGHCYVNYYKGTELFKTVAIYFRGDEFNEKFDLYERFMVDDNQPQYTFSGEIRNINNIVATFNGLNNKTFDVYYEPIETQIVVNYYKIEDDGSKTELASETIALKEKDFYQVPTFGDIVRLNKYKPDGYETNFKYTGSKVSLARVVEGSPYSIEYTKMVEDKIPYTTTIKYIKKVFGVRQYETIGTKIITLDQSDFRDGEYIDFYIDKNLMKPEKFYKDGTTYQWYEMDERLESPENLKESYTIMYAPERQYLDVNYYTDEVDDENYIAGMVWSLAIDELDPRLEYSIVDIFPNEYINKFKPMICAGGKLQNAETKYTFESLVEFGHVDIVYETIEEPNDPTEAYYEKKVLGFGLFSELIPAGVGGLDSASWEKGGGCIPYIDLGYTPKELKRLKVEIKTVGQASGFLCQGGTVNGGFQDTSYTSMFGYNVPKDYSLLGTMVGDLPDADEILLDNFYSVKISDQLKGNFDIKPRLPVASGWVYTSEGPQSLDGQVWYTASSAAGVIPGTPRERYTGYGYSFRNGYASILDENYNEIDCFNEYGGYKEIEYMASGGRPLVDWVVNTERASYLPLANPMTIIMDAYNHYLLTYTEEDSNNAIATYFEDTDEDIFEARLQPRGSLTLFRSRNPLDGEMNIMPINHVTVASMSSTGLMGLSGKNNPYTGSAATVEIEVLVQIGVDSSGAPIFQTQKQQKNVKYVDFPVPVYPSLEACAVWGVKIWDRDRLVRDMIPVAAGDKVYDYTMPANGLFDLVTEIFFGNANEGGEYTQKGYFSITGGALKEDVTTVTVKPEDVFPLWVILDPGYYGKMTMNYYDYDYSFITSQFINVPTWYSKNNTTKAEILGYNDYKPDDFHLDGLLDLGDGADSPIDTLTLYEIWQMNSANVFYKLRTFTKTVVYYRGNYRVGSKDIFYSLEDIENALTMDDLGIDVDLYWNEDFAHGRIVFDESIIAASNIQDFIDAPSPIVVYDKLSKEDAPNLLYVEYYRGGASDDTLITLDPHSPNYLDCNLDGVVLNPNGAIKYYNHYHSALYEDEQFDYFIPYQVRVLDRYTGIHRGPARRFPTLALIVDKDVYTIIEERNGWGRLKEYPVGWIMLSATEPMTGPGQNPDYDIPGSEDVATLPFGSEVHITKLTVDRLWCYVPEVESWVKAEDISYNQSGKLYNALDMDVIHLDELDFSTVQSLSDVGIYPQKRLLYFHDREDYVYNGEYTYEAFSDLHELEFIYPETVYHYSCIYYKDNIGEWWDGAVITPGSATGIGTSSTDYSVIRTVPFSNAGKKVSSFGKNATGELISPRFNCGGFQWYKIRYTSGSKVYEGYIKSTELQNIVEPVCAGKIQTNEVGRASFSCSIGDWNPDWDVFIETSWKVDENGKELQPDLYRDTELTLTWGYFGFEKNLFRPEGYSDGIYLWNPRSWQPNGDIRFTFKELVRVGTQYVLYPCIQPDLYKIWVTGNAVNYFTTYTGTTKATWYPNPGIRGVNLSTATMTGFRDYIGDPEEEKIVDINYEGELIVDNTLNTGGALNSFTTTSTMLGPNTIKPVTVSSGTYKGSQYPSITAFSSTMNPGFTFGTTEINKYGLTHLYGYGEGYSVNINFSNFRESPTAVFGFANTYEGRPYEHYIWDDDYGAIPILETTNLSGYNDLQTKPATTTGGLGSIIPVSDIGLSSQDFRGLIYGAQSYETFMLQHWWVPVPKGLWYKRNGQDMRIPDNGLYDIITGDFCDNYKMTDGPIGQAYTGSSYYDYSVYADGKEYVFLRDQAPVIGTEYDYFDNWFYNTTNVYYIVEATTDASTYEQPDIYAIKVRDLAPGLVFPISKLTADADNRVIGEWYFSGDQWIETSNTKIHAGTFNPNQLTKLQQTFCLVEPAIAETYYVYLDPSAVGTVGEKSKAVYSGGYVDTSFYKYTTPTGQRFYFDGAYWVPEKYTSFNTTELNKNYAVIPDSLPFYSHPILDDAYIAGNYHYGERITVPYVTTQDPEWGYTGIGWVRLNTGTVSEIL